MPRYKRMHAERERERERERVRVKERLPHSFQEATRTKEEFATKMAAFLTEGYKAGVADMGIQRCRYDDRNKTDRAMQSLRDT